MLYAVSGISVTVMINGQFNHTYKEWFLYLWFNDRGVYMCVCVWQGGGGGGGISFEFIICLY